MDAVNHYLNQNLTWPSHANLAGRGYPDLTSQGTHCPTWINGQLIDAAGTSCSTPIIAGLVSLLSEHQMKRGRPQLGYANPIMYAMPDQCYHDMTSGNNWCTESTCCPNKDGSSEYGYVATSGWDPVTGRGTPNITCIIDWLNNNT